MERMLTTTEVAKTLGVSRRYVTDLIRSGRIRAFKLGDAQQSTWRVRESDLLLAIVQTQAGMPLTVKAGTAND